jgi:hypothetical protein
MTITRIAPGLWELRSRHGALFGTGDLYTVVTLWARMRREGWSDIPYGQPAFNQNGRRTIECTRTRDCACRACHARLG